MIIIIIILWFDFFIIPTAFSLLSLRCLVNIENIVNNLKRGNLLIPFQILEEGKAFKSSSSIFLLQSAWNVGTKEV